MLHAGFARREITPPPGVELTGWGYYIERRWTHIRDAPNVTAAVFRNAGATVAIVTLDLMLIDTRFTNQVRGEVGKRLGLRADSVLLTCSHSHNTPAAGGLRGVGECDPTYERWAAEQAVLAVEQALDQLQPSVIRIGTERCGGLTFNRTREHGVVDDHFTAVAVESTDGTVIGVLCNFAAHPTVMTELMPTTLTRDIPGEICDRLEQHYPDAVALYLQGACGDTNFHRRFQTLSECHQPAEILTNTTLQILAAAEVDEEAAVCSASQTIQLPTRRWLEQEVMPFRQEAERRLREHDLSGWREGFGRSMTNRPDDMVTRHGGDEWKAVAAMCRFHLEWTEEILPDLQTRDEILETEVQAVRVGRLFVVSNSAEFFSPFALQIRERFGQRPLMIACYANGRIGYLPDEHDLLAGSYAGLQSPKYCGQFPFTAESGPEMCRGMLAVLERCERQS